MPTLLLLRHAKSDWSKPRLRDFERPLAPRGERAAARVGGFIAENHLAPDLVLCSPAKRAHVTLALVLGKLESKPEIRFADGLYMAGPATMMTLLTELEGKPERVMMVGHNPGFQAFALMVCGGGGEEDLAALARKFPTAALAVIDFDGQWKDIGAGRGRLRLFATPRALKEASPS